MKILIETSAHHVHLCQRDLDVLFGEGTKLTVKKYLSQPNQYASYERIDLIGPKGKISNVSILGPVRECTQVEVSMTETRKLGVSAVIRESGDLKDTPGCTLVGPAGKININSGVIVAKRHIHLDAESARKFNLNNEQIVSVKVNTEQRSLIFNDVVIRVNEKFSPAFHIDTDEANAAGIFTKTYGDIIF